MNTLCVSLTTKAFLILVVSSSALLLCMEDQREFNPKIGNFGGSTLQRLSIIEDDRLMVDDGADKKKTDWEAKFIEWGIEAKELQEKIYQRESRLAQEMGELHMANGPYHAAFLPLPQGASEEAKQVSTQSYHAAFLPLLSIPNPASQATEEWLIKRDQKAEYEKKLELIMYKRSQEIEWLKKEIEENTGILAIKEARLNAAKSAMGKVGSVIAASWATTLLLGAGATFLKEEHHAKIVCGALFTFFVPMYGSLCAVAHKYPEIESKRSIAHYEREIQELNETIKSKKDSLSLLEYKQKSRCM